MIARNTYLWDGDEMAFEGKIFDDDGKLLIETDDLEDYIAALEAVEAREAVGAGLDKKKELCEAKCTGCDKSCDRCDEDEDDEEDECEEEDDLPDDIESDWDVIDMGDMIDRIGEKYGVVKSIHIHSVELLAYAAAALLGFKLLKKLWKR